MASCQKVNFSTGLRYMFEIDFQLFVLYNTRTGIKYLKCVVEDCSARAIIKNEWFKLNEALHAEHESTNTATRESFRWCHVQHGIHGCITTYQLCTVFVPFQSYIFPVCFCLMTQVSTKPASLNILLYNCCLHNLIIFSITRRFTVTDAMKSVRRLWRNWFGLTTEATGR